MAQALELPSSIKPPPRFGVFDHNLPPIALWASETFQEGYSSTEEEIEEGDEEEKEEEGEDHTDGDEREGSDRVEERGGGKENGDEEMR